MPSKKRKYNARFPAGRIKKIMQTDEEVGKVAQAVPIIISRTLELFVESLLSKALQVTVNRNAKTLSPSHVKQCIQAESRFDFLRDLVKNIPDVSAAEEKELMSAESSPTSSRVSDVSAPSCDRVQATPPLTPLLRGGSIDPTPPAPQPPGLYEGDNVIKIEPLLLTGRIEPPPPTTEAIDLTKKPVRTANFYQETLTDEVQSVIKVNPTYSSSQPSTSYTTLNPVPPLRKIDVTKTNFDRRNSGPRTPVTPKTNVTPIINIDFSKNLAVPEIKVIDAATPKEKKISRQSSKSKIDVKKAEIKPIPQLLPVDIDSLNSGNLQIDEDYDT